MKKVILLLLLFPYPSFGQISFDFESGSIAGWTEGVEGRWKADTEGSLVGNYSLHHIFDNSAGGWDCAGTPLTDLHPLEGTTKWSFSVMHGCDPSASNSWALFLMSDSDPALFSNGSSVSGFAAGVNLSGYDDTLRIWKIRRGSVSVVAVCPVNWQNDIGPARPAGIIVERTISGIWTLEARDEGNNILGSASGYDPDLFNPAWLILNYRYTSTRDRLLWLDDVSVEGVFYEDRIPPDIISVRVTRKNSLEITLSEDTSDDILSADNYTLKDSGEKPSVVIKKLPGVIETVFEKEFRNKTKNHLTISRLCDRSGNCATDAEAEFTPVWADPGDVIISEIMADPLPVVSLPAAEYLEITNRTLFPLDLRNWSLSTESQNYLFPQIIISPGEYIILCSSASAGLFSEYGRTAGFKSFPALTDAGRIIFLSDSTGTLIHGVEYSSAWYGNKLKEDGGWSLEMIDTGYPFYSDGNWEASSSGRGGTPGKANSSSRPNPDLYFRGLQNVFPDESNTLSISLSETFFGLAGSPGKIIIEGAVIIFVTSSDPLLRRFIVRVKEPLVAGREYTFFLTGDIRDFAGNEISGRSFRFGIPEPVQKRDIVFNELLFNPLPDDPDYIEFVNISERTIDASRLYLASIASPSGDTSSVRALSDEARCIMPGSLYVATTDPGLVTDRYFSADPENIYRASSLPSMPDDRGHLLLFSREMKLVDKVIYTDKMHYPLLSDTEGISLEKVRTEALSDESMNWHSASESSGWGTPGSGNSVFSPYAAAGDVVSLSSERISPGNDGFEDVLIIDLDPVGAGSVVTVTVFDERGGFVKRIADNYLAGERASLVWDATAADGSLVRRGIYIILIELYDASGKTRSWKKICAVIR